MESGLFRLHRWANSLSDLTGVVKQWAHALHRNSNTAIHLGEKASQVIKEPQPSKSEGWKGENAINENSSIRLQQHAEDHERIDGAAGAQSWRHEFIHCTHPKLGTYHLRGD